eukprot:1196278-Prorocentrum_minimum.AAC.3
MGGPLSGLSFLAGLDTDTVEQTAVSRAVTTYMHMPHLRLGGVCAPTSPNVIGSHYRNIRPPLASLVRTMEISNLPSRDWFALREYPTSPHVIGSHCGNIRPPLT